MQPRKGSANQISQRKGVGSRQQNQQQPPSHNQKNPQKQKQDHLLILVKEYLQKNGYPRSFQSLKNQRPVKRVNSSNYGLSNRQLSGNTNSDEKSVLLHFDKGHRQQFFKQTTKIFSVISTGVSSNFNEQYIHSLRKLQFQLNIYFCIYSIHPCINTGSYKKSVMDKSAAQAFKKFIQSKGTEMSEQSQLLSFFALPFIPKPQQNPSMARVFTKQWVNKLRNIVIQAYREHYSKNTSVSFNKQNKKTYNSQLQEIYDTHLQNTKERSQEMVSKAKFQQQSYIQKIQEVQKHNRELISYIDILRQHLKDLNQASKSNLIESNRKWFQFSKQIMLLTKAAIKGDKNVKQRLERYQKFFGTNIDDLIYNSADISIFDKNSYTEDVSIIPGLQKKMTNQVPSSNSPQQNFCQIDTTKILSLFMKANNPQFQLQICLLLKALKTRLCSNKSIYSRRQVIINYQRTDICCVKQYNYAIQQKLLIEGTQRVKQFYLRLMNYMSTDNLGNQYLSSSQKLIQNLIGIMGTTDEDVPYRKHVFGILQRFSYLKQPQLMMVSFGIIPMILKVFRNEGQTLQYTSIQYLMSLLMNLAIRKQCISSIQKNKNQLLAILIKYIDVQDQGIRAYINGTLYVLVQLQSIKKQAVEKFKLKELLIDLLQKNNGTIQQEFDLNDNQEENARVRQYKYILERIQEEGQQQFQVQEQSDEEDYQEMDDMEDIDMNSENQSVQSDQIQGEENTLTGEELLIKRYALLGPQAVREELLTRSILDETGRKSHNLTASINISKRVDRVFQKNQRPETPSLLPANLDLSITPTR